MFSLERFLPVAALALASGAAQAQFSLAVSPPRFELATQPGTPVRDVIQLSSDDSRAVVYSVKTADWKLEADGSVTFSDALAEDSCRPWVAIERREVTVAVGRPYRFRFEVAPPPGVAPQECRFAIMLEGKEQAGALPLPIAARVGVIVYVAVGGVAPELKVLGGSVESVGGQSTPALRVRNEGSAHGRLDGFLTATDAGGATLELTPSNAPILPGETRSIPLQASAPGATQPTLRFPLMVRGKLEWGKGRSTPLEQRFAP